MFSGNVVHLTAICEEFSELEGRKWKSRDQAIIVLLLLPSRIITQERKVTEVKIWWAQVLNRKHNSLCHFEDSNQRLKTQKIKVTRPNLEIAGTAAYRVRHRDRHLLI